VIFGFRRDVDAICALRGYYAASSGNSIPKFRDSLSVPSSKIKKSKSNSAVILNYWSVSDFRISPGRR
jgi:hypothetical protein